MTLAAPAEPAGTVAVMVVALTTVKLVAAVPPNVTLVAPVKFVPVIVTVLPPAGGPELGVTEVTMGAGATFAERSRPNANPPDPLAIEIVTLVIGVVVVAANSSAPEAPIGDRVIVPRVVEPFKNVTVVEKAGLLFGSSSKPKVVTGRVSVIVSASPRDVGYTTFTGLPSVFGALPHVAQPPNPVAAAVAAVIVLEKVSVWVESVSTVPAEALFAAVIAIAVVLPVYVASGVEIGVNCPKAVASPTNPNPKTIWRMRIGYSVSERTFQDKVFSGFSRSFAADIEQLISSTSRSQR